MQADPTYLNEDRVSSWSEIREAAKLALGSHAHTGTAHRIRFTGRSFPVSPGVGHL